MTKDEAPTRMSAIDWQQEISRSLGCRLGETTYPLDECVARIKQLQGRVDSWS